jgi:deoxyribodipyrimidine photo-lyase
MRTKVHKLLSTWLEEPPTLQTHPHNLAETHKNDWTAADRLIEQVPDNGSELTYLSGEQAAHELLRLFIAQKLPRYALDRNDPSQHGVSGLSPYLHFGQIASLRVALELIKHVSHIPLLLKEARLAHGGETPSELDGMNALLEEMIVRKELADNYCFYTPDYTSLSGTWDWAKDTLNAHADDPREFLYTRDQLEQAQTHDLAWNAAQNEMRHTGKMHGYMRMYWAKKILEWTRSADEAISIAIYLNDHYSIDGGDPNGYVGIMWSIAGVHDRPWFDRPIYGKIRYMNTGGLLRKFDLDNYIASWTRYPADRK